jgi:hypothetical protein
MNSVSSNYISSPESTIYYNSKPTIPNTPPPRFPIEKSEDDISIKSLPSISSITMDELPSPVEVQKSPKKNSPLSFNSYINSLFKAALNDDRKTLESLFENRS